MNIVTCDNPAAVAQRFAADLMEWVRDSSGRFNIALSGGSTPQILFQYWAENTQAEDWRDVHFYWGDERCVSPVDAESNFRVTNELFFEPLQIPADLIHRIHGEDPPIKEAERYSRLITDNLNGTEILPKFDVVLLGMGTDGHTASIFPDQMELLDDERLCSVATHPDSGQKRVTLTGNVIAAAERIAFLVTGESKKEKLAAIRSKSEPSNCWPATRFMHQPNTTVYVDLAAVG